VAKGHDRNKSLDYSGPGIARRPVIFSNVILLLCYNNVYETLQIIDLCVNLL